MPLEGANNNSIEVSANGVAIPAPNVLSDINYSLTIVREDGSVDYPHSIATAEELAAIGTGNLELNDTYQLVNDIDLTDYLSASGAGYNGGDGWDPIGDEASPFTGTLLGNKHVIKSLFANRNDEDYVGLFAVLAGTVHDLSLSQINIIGRDDVGGLAGEIDGGTITNSYITGSVSSTGARVGGLAGSLKAGIIENSYAVSVVTGSVDAGGVIGYSENDGVTNSYWDTSISGQLSSAGGSGAVGKSTLEMHTVTTFDGWDFATIWAMIDGTTYPMFQSTFEAVKLDILYIEAGNAVLDWDPNLFKPERGDYIVVADEYITSVYINAIDADSSSTIAINGNVGVTRSIPVSPGDNVIEIRTVELNGFGEGKYTVTVRVPAPKLIELDIPADGYYRAGDVLLFNVAYEGEVDVTGNPFIPITIGEGLDTVTVNAVYIGKPIGELNTLSFAYTVEAGLVDTDSIEIGTAIELPLGAEITASGIEVSLALPVVNLEGIKLDAKAPTLVLSQYPDGSTVTRDEVTITATADGTGSAIAELRQAEGIRTIDYFASGGTLLVGDSFEVAANGTYTVYAIDQAGNETIDTIQISNIATELPQISISTDPSTVTNEEVMITVTATVSGTGNELSKLNWLTGSYTVDDFEEGAVGEDILGSNEFEVDANGTYTVYARDAAGNETVVEIEIENIVTTLPTILLTHSPTTSTNGKVTVTVEANVAGSGNTLAKLYWLAGSRTAIDFAGGTVGEDILGSNEFEVDASGTYTVYARDAAGNEKVAEIEIENIVTTLPTILLTHSPTTSTNGKVAVTVEANVAGSGNTLVKLNWLAGSRTAVDFEGGTVGEDILGSNEFEVDASGTYTVYARDAAGNEKVAEIEIENIVTTLPTILLTHSPITLTNGKVTVTVEANVTGSGNTLAKLNWLAGSRTTFDFVGGTVGEDILGTNEFEVDANGTYTVFARDAAGNEKVTEIEIENIVTTLPTILLTHNPTTSTNGKVTVTVEANVTGSGNTLAKLNWLAGSRTALDFAGGAVGEDILGGNEFEVKANGTYTVYARDTAGNEKVTEIKIRNIVKPAPADNDVVEEPSQTQPAISIVKDSDGKITIVIHRSGITKEVQDDGSIIDRVALTDEQMRQLSSLLASASSSQITIKVDELRRELHVQFLAESLNELLDDYHELEFAIRLQDSSFQLHVNELNLEQLAKQLDVDLDELQMSVAIEQVTEQEQAQLEQAAGEQGHEPVGRAVTYSTYVSSPEGKNIKIQDFGGTYITRSITVDHVSAGVHFIALMYDPATKSFHFVPAVTTVLDDGKLEIIIKSPYFGIYTIMETEKKTFEDLSGHWAQKDVELLATKQIIQGISAAHFLPDASITRAEFTALLVRALGIRTADKASKLAFDDVSAEDWYAASIEAAVGAGLVKGISSDQFAPNQEITREQMAVMIENALSFVGITGLDSSKATALLQPFADQADISTWARSAVAQAISLRIMQGEPNGTLVTKEHATRAQAAVMLKRLLQHIEFIDSE